MALTIRHLMWHGMFLFLLGLLTGLLEQRFTNVRMGMAAHLEGVLNARAGFDEILAEFQGPASRQP